VLVLDVNVVVAAHRDDHQHFPVVDDWFKGILAGPAPFAVPFVVWASFLRLVTSPRIFDPPTPLADAFAFVEGICTQPNYLPMHPGPDHMRLLGAICLDANATSDLIPDAVIAAIALEHGAVVASFDRDFARFSSIDYVVPGRN
jgi:toxin-antitoxin system PIN domain toxin